MKFDKLVVLVPCHHLEDFPVHLGGRDAESLLAAWTALWHPALVAAAQTMPSWSPADDPPEPSSTTLYSIAEVSRSLLPESWQTLAKQQGACVLCDFASREELIDAALSAIGQSDHKVDPDLTADFLALGYAFFQIELLTREMRYTSHVDDVHFGNLVTTAATAAVAGDRAAANEALQSSFDALAESRDHFYPVDSYLVDLTLVASTTIGEALRDQLSRDTPTNLLLTGEVVETMAAKQPDTLEAVKQSLQKRSSSLVGGEYSAAPLAIATHESFLAQLRRGQRAYEQWLGCRATVYGRDQYGISPMLPGVLGQAGYVGALHFALDGGVTPQPEQCKASWQGVDGSTIDVLARLPQTVTEAGVFLNLASRLSHSMERDHVATLVFAHWPGEDRWWFEDLRRVTARGTALGKFVTLDEYFSTTDVRGAPFRFEADEYRWPYLRRAAAAGVEEVVSRTIGDIRVDAESAAKSTLRTIAALVSPCPSADESVPSGSNDDRTDSVNNYLSKIRSALTPIKTGGDREGGSLIVNPYGAATWATVDVARAGAPAESLARLAKVPALGYARVDEETVANDANSASIPLASENILRNEQMEVTVNTVTGAIQAISDYRQRGNMFSGQLAFRDPRLAVTGASTSAGESIGPYSVMAADEVAVTVADDARGEITSRGRLVDREGQVLARFVQRFRLERRRPVLEVDVELEIEVPPGDNPRTSYCAWRSAWADELAEIWRSEMLTSQPTTARHFVSPHFVDIRGRHRLAVLCGGLPYHVRGGDRNLDTLLVAGNEPARRFRLGIGVGLDYPLTASLELLAPVARFATPAAPMIANESGWFFHIDRKNVVATSWQPLIGEDGTDGFRVRLLETEGRSAQVCLAAFRPVGDAWRTDLLGQRTDELRIDEGRVCLRMGAYEWAQIEARC